LFCTCTWCLHLPNPKVLAPLTCAACLQAFFILAEWLLALLAWLLPEWRHLSLAAAGMSQWPVVHTTP
jgi:hypothetical protein